ncbi:MarR family transcriptional regulator [Cellulomonas humilata]|uniref:DNA-binding MarR family transcriptional regulator n=1 Tax=Cellulomonas humilata TaxID=144055 RepID=A0ABU0EF77_9CELL|nr:MarR family transcriptional regulator [Cellulomonas humilata]MDQ0373917.1 DNA-binding MarR family transcriptional regulator [Cellulomonas humilata]
MASEVSADDRRRKRRLAVDVRDAMRELSIQLDLLNHQVSQRLDMRDVDLDCLDLIGRHGPLGASALARLAGLHPATMTGVLDRLEKGGWIVRERSAEDRRAIVVRAAKERGAEIYQLYSGMNASMEGLLDGYSERDLTVIADFLTRAREAGVAATGELARD